MSHNNIESETPLLGGKTIHMKTGLFFIGATVGLVAGAILIGNNYAARRFVRDTQDTISSKLREKANHYRFKMEAAKDGDCISCGCNCDLEVNTEELFNSDDITDIEI